MIEKTRVTTLSSFSSSPSLYSLSVFAGPVHLSDIRGVQHRGKSALCLKAVGVNERNDKFLMGFLLKSCVGDRVCSCTYQRVSVRDSRVGRGHRFHASVPLPFMLGLTYMHPSPTI